MKKSLVLLPLAALALSGCSLIPSVSPGGLPTRPKTSTPTSEPTSEPTSAPTTSPTSEPTSEPTSVPTSVPTSDPTSDPTSAPTSQSPVPMDQGVHTLTYNFGTDFNDYKESFPYVDAETGVDTDHSLGDLPIVSNGCFVGSYNNVGYLMMKNKDRSTVAFIGNYYDLVAITKITFTAGASASTAQKYDISFGHTAFEAAQSSGTEVAHPGGTVTKSADEGYGFFAISTKDKSKNGQIGTLTIEYTIGGGGGGGGTTTSVPPGPTTTGGTTPVGEDTYQGYRKVLAAPVNDKEYIYGIYQGNLDEYIFLNGDHHRDENGEYPFYLTTTQDVTKAVRVKCHYTDETHFTIQIIGGGEYTRYDGKYLEIYEGTKPSGTTVTSLRAGDTPGSWYYLESYEGDVIQTNVQDLAFKGTDYPVAMGTYEEYETFSALTNNHFASNFIAHLWEEDEGGGGGGGTTSDPTSQPTSAPTSDPTSSPTSAPTSAQPGETVTVTKTMPEIVEENGFTLSEGQNAVMYTSFPLDSNITVSTSGEANCGSFWWTAPDTQWRIYQNKNGDINIATSSGTISTVKITFLSQNNGTLLNGSATVASDEVVTVNAASIRFTTGNSGTATNGQIRVTAISVVYTPEGGTPVVPTTTGTNPTEPTPSTPTTAPQGAWGSEDQALMMEHLGFLLPALPGTWDPWTWDTEYEVLYSFADGTTVADVQAAVMADGWVEDGTDEDGDMWYVKESCELVAYEQEGYVGVQCGQMSAAE